MQAADRRGWPPAARAAGGTPPLALPRHPVPRVRPSWRLPRRSLWRRSRCRVEQAHPARCGGGCSDGRTPPAPRGWGAARQRVRARRRPCRRWRRHCLVDPLRSGTSGGRCAGRHAERAHSLRRIVRLAAAGRGGRVSSVQPSGGGGGGRHSHLVAHDAQLCQRAKPPGSQRRFSCHRPRCRVCQTAAWLGKQRVTYLRRECSGGAQMRPQRCPRAREHSSM